MRSALRSAMRRLWILGPMLALGLTGSAGVEDRFLRALKQGEVDAARHWFLRAQPDAARVLEQALATAPPAQARQIRQRVRLLQPRLENFALSEIASADSRTLVQIFRVKESARLEMEKGDAAAARRGYLQALAMSRAASWRWQQQRFLFLIADTYGAEGLSEEARRWLAQAADLEDPRRPTHLDAMAHEHMGYQLVGVGDVPTALRHFQRALERHAAIDYPEGIAVAANNLALLFVEAGNCAAAADYYRQSLRYFERDDSRRLDVENNLADCLLEMGMHEEAGSLVAAPAPRGSAPYFQRIALQARRLRATGHPARAAARAASGLAEVLRSGNVEWISDFVRDGLRAALSAVEAERATERVLPLLDASDRNRWEIHWRLAELFARERNWPKTEAFARKAFADLRRNPGGEFEFNFSARALQVARLWSLALVHQDRSGAALTVWEKAKAYALQRPYGSAAEIQASLGPLCAVIDFLITERETLVWIVTRHGVESRVLELPERALSREIESLLDPFMNPRNLLDPLYSSGLSRKIYQWILGPLETVLGPMRCWTILADGPLHALPLELLEDRRGRSVGERADIRYWQTLAGPADASRRLQGVTALADDPDQEAAFLPPGAWRVRSWEEAIHGSGDVFHFGGHSFSDSVYPAASALETSGEVAARAIARARLSYRLVVLGSCDSGGEVAAFGAGLLGLSAAFQVAGARQVVASLWPVDRHSTELLRDFYALARSEADLASGLGRARRSFRGRWYRSAGYELPMSSPYFWAPFILIAPHDFHASPGPSHATGLLLSLAGVCALRGYRRSKIANRKSQIENRRSKIANRHFRSSIFDLR